MATASDLRNMLKRLEAYEQHGGTYLGGKSTKLWKCPKKNIKEGPSGKSRCLSYGDKWKRVCASEPKPKKKGSKPRCLDYKKVKRGSSLIGGCDNYGMCENYIGMGGAYLGGRKTKKVPRKRGPKGGSCTPWVVFVKEFAKENNMSYSDVLKGPAKNGGLRSAYKYWYTEQLGDIPYRLPDER